MENKTALQAIAYCEEIIRALKAGEYPKQYDVVDCDAINLITDYLRKV